MSHKDIRITQIDQRDVWESFVSRYNPVALFQSWDWGEVQKSLGVPVHRYGLFANSKLKGIWQVTTIKARRGTFLHVRHGPILEAYDRSLLDACTSFLCREARKEKAVFIRISPLVSPAFLDAFARVGFRPSPMHAMDAEYCWVLDLSPSVDQLLGAMRKSTRYDIKKATQLGVTITVSTSEKDLDSFFHLYTKTSVRHGFVPHAGIRQEFSIFTKLNKARLYIATHERKRLAMAVVLHYGSQAIYHHGASIPTKIPASALLQWTAIQDAKAAGLGYYNFWGIAPENQPKHPWAGITGFKKGFGGSPVEYLHAQDKAISPLYIVPFTIETARRIYKGY